MRYVFMPLFLSPPHLATWSPDISPVNTIAFCSAVILHYLDFQIFLFHLIEIPLEHIRDYRSAMACT